MPLHDLPGGSGAGESLAKSSIEETCTFRNRPVLWAAWHWR